MDEILVVKHLTVGYGKIPVVQDVSMTIDRGEIVGLVGESGCGKSTFLRTLMMLTDEKMHVMGGSVIFEGKDLTKLTEQELRFLRGKKISMVFQNSAEVCNPVKTIRSHFRETMNSHGERHSKKECMEKAKKLLQQLKFQDPERILNSYPFELSGGMNQRVGIALAMLNHPPIMLADEPTSALDVTVQMQVLKEMYDLRKEFQTTIVLVTHSIGVVAGICDTVGVMYGGHIVEWGDCEELLSYPSHPYTKALIAAVPTETGGDLKGIPGMPPDFGKDMEGCPFAPRCAYVSFKCRQTMPKQQWISQKHWIRCCHPLGAGGEQ